MTERAIPKFDFLGKAFLAVPLSIVIMAASLAIFFQKGESKYGVDFTGGHEILVRVGPEANSDKIRSALARAGMDDAIVQSFEAGSNEYLVHLEGAVEEADALKGKVASTLKGGVSETVEVLKNDFVGPTVGNELKRKALIAIAIALAGMLALIAYRFELAFAIGAVASLLHDVIVCTGAYLYFGHTLSMGALAAALTITGYSVNDTIVIFDRIREEIHKQRGKFHLAELMNRCINMMLSRTLITHLLTFFSVLALLVFGGGAIRDLAMFLLCGIVAGTYSTIYIACPIVIAFHKLRGGSIEQE